MEETHQPDERDNDSRGERETPRLHTRMGIPGNKKGRESTKQRTRTNAHANMEIYYNSTHESIARRNTAEQHKNRHNMEANDEYRLITRIHAIQHKTERARIKRKAKQEGFSHYNTNKK